VKVKFGSCWSLIASANAGATTQGVNLSQKAGNIREFMAGIAQKSGNCQRKLFVVVFGS